MNGDKIRYWVRRNSVQITWFVIGWLVTSGIRDLLMGNIVGAALSFGFAYLNYVLSK